MVIQDLGTAVVKTAAISFDNFSSSRRRERYKKITKTAVRSLSPSSVGTVELYIQPRPKGPGLAKRGMCIN